jgi:hypothetical protein
MKIKGWAAAYHSYAENVLGLWGRLMFYRFEMAVNNEYDVGNLRPA